MKRRLFTAVALSFIIGAGDWSLAATNNTNTNKGGTTATAPQPTRPAPSSDNGGRRSGASTGNNSPKSTGAATSTTKKSGDSGRSMPGYYNNATGSYYPSGYGPNNPKPAVTSTPSQGQVPYRRDHRYDNYYGNYYPGYYGGGYPYGTTPYGLGYNAYGQPYLYPINPGYGYGGYYGGNGYGGYAYGGPAYGAYYGSPFGDASQLFGPGPILRMMGADQWANPNNAVVGGGNAGGVDNGNRNFNAGGGGGNNAQANAGNNAANNNAANNDAAKQADRPPPGRAAAVAWKFITYGDGYFGKKKYNDAADRYRTASRQSNTVADAWFRQGFALAALGKYDQSAKAFRHGLEINPDWATSDFHLADIYGADDDEKKAKIDTMTGAAESQPNNPDVAFVLGVHLYFDGQTDKATPFFRKAAQISGSNADVKGFVAAKQ